LVTGVVKMTPEQMLANKRRIDAQRKAKAIARIKAEEAAAAEQRRQANLKAMHRIAGGVSE
jgi:hypothetical protein